MIIRKLENKKGITIIHALVSVLIFAVFGSIIFSATATNMKSYNSQKDYQQAYLTVSSAAEMIIDSIDGDTIEFRKTVGLVHVHGNEYADGESTIDNWHYKDANLRNAFINKTASASITSYNDADYDIYTMFKTAYNKGSFGVATNPITYKINTTVKDKFSSEVTCVMSMNDKGSLIINLYISPESVKNNNNYYMSLEIPVDIQSLQPQDTETTNKKYSINGSWYNSYKEELYKVSYDMKNIIVSNGTK